MRNCSWPQDWPAPIPFGVKSQHSPSVPFSRMMILLNSWKMVIVIRLSHWRPWSISRPTGASLTHGINSNSNLFYTLFVPDHFGQYDGFSFFSICRCRRTELSIIFCRVAHSGWRRRNRKVVSSVQFFSEFPVVKPVNLLLFWWYFLRPNCPKQMTPHIMKSSLQNISHKCIKNTSSNARTN